MIRLLFCMAIWVTLAIFAALIGFPVLFLTGRIELLWRLSVWAAQQGYTMAGVRVRVEGREHLPDGQAALFLANHVSNLDPPIITFALGRRIAILAKKQLFRIPLLGYGMHKAGFVAVDREHRRSAVESLRVASERLRGGLSILIFPEGTRSPDGLLLPFKKGPFYIAMAAGVPVIPITILGSFEAWPKRRFSLRPIEVVVHLHPPLDPKQFASQEELMAVVRAQIGSLLPETLQE